jgi:DNA-binding NtrC family response regulator
LLLAHFAKKTAGNQLPLEFSESTIELLMHYSWPGNIRELSNLVAYLRTMTDAQTVEPEDLPPKIRDQASALLKRPTEAASDEKAVNFYEAVATFEKDFLLREQNQTQGNVSRMAMRLGMDRSHLYSKLREHGLHAGKSKN